MSTRQKLKQTILTMLAALMIVSVLFAHPASVQAATTITTPTLSSVTAAKTSTSGIVVTWTKVSGASGYQVYRKSSLATTYTKMKTISGSATVSYTDTTVKNGISYTYKVRAYSGSSYSSFSKTKTLTYLSDPGVSLANTYSGAVILRWTKNASAAGYNIYRKTESGSYSKITTITKNTTTSWTDTSVKSGTTYSYIVRAYTGSYQSSYVSKTIMYLAPINSGDLTVNNFTKGSYLTWPRVIGASSYRVYRRTPGGTYSILTTKTGTVYTDTSAVSGTTYEYKVRAISGSYMGSCTPVTSMYLSALSSDKVTLSASSTGVTIKWTAVTGANTYKVYRRLDGSDSYSLLKEVTGTSYTDTTTAYSTKYEYWVRAVNGSYMGSYDTLSITTPACSHTYDSGLVTKEPTCTASGTQVYTCTNCGAKKTVTLDALGHSYTTKVTYPTTTSQGYTTYTCTRCGNSYKGDYTDKITLTADIQITVAGTTYYLGEPAAALGTPAEKLTSVSTKGYTWYVYGTSTYKNFFAAGVIDERVVALVSAGPGFTYQGMKCGSQLGTYTNSNCSVTIATDSNDDSIVHAVMIADNAYSGLGNFAADKLAGESKLIFHLTNAFRVYHGLTPLKWDTNAETAAILHSQDMAAYAYFSHDSRSDDTRYANTGFSARLTAAGIGWLSCGENITMGTGWYYGNGFRAYNNWVNSSGHRTNMLRSYWVYLGVGGGYGSNGCTYYTQDFWY